MIDRRTGLALGATVSLLLCAGGGGRIVRTEVWNSTAPYPMHPAIPHAGLTRSATSCAPCHPAIVEAWGTSRMGNAMKNPGFLIDWEQNQDRLQTCLNCHAPLQDQQPLVLLDVAAVIPSLRFDSQLHPAFDPTLQEEGVTCLACHGSPTGLASLQDAREACVRCHSMPTSWLHRLDRPLIDTVGEHERWRATTGRTEDCVDCHMTPGTDHRGHDFHGAEDPQGGGGVSLSNLRHTGSEIHLELQNLAGHRIPTGETSPALRLAIEVLDAEGVVCHTDEVVLSRVVRGPPFVEVEDSTLAPAESRSVAFSLPPAVGSQAATARVRLSYERHWNLPTVRRALTLEGTPTSVTLDQRDLHW